MKQRVSMVMMSHLSDVQELMGLGGNPKLQSNRIDFVKFLMLKYKDTSTEIDPDAEYALFIEKYPNKKIA